MSGQAASQSLQGYYRWHAHFYDATRWTFLFGRTALIRRAAERPSPQRILEVGCGTGKNLAELARCFPQARIVGLDLSSDMLSKARKKVEIYGPRVSLIEGAYRFPVSDGDPFDLILLSYCLSMINPGFAEVLHLCEQDLSARGYLALVDFHDTRFAWFRRWMSLNHVRMDGQILAALEGARLSFDTCVVMPAYGGLWRWFACLASRRTSA